MADPTTFPEEHVSAPLIYRPISGFAIAAIIVASGYALIVVLACIAGLSEATPVLLSPWLQAVAVIGAGLAIAAWVQINRSEGTIAGLKLTLWSLFLSAFFGLGYVAYYVATYLAIRSQADTFTQRWVRKLEDGKVNSAFLDTQDPAQRKNVNPEDEEGLNARFPAAGMARQMAGKTPLEMFRDNQVVHIIFQGGPASRVTPLGVKDWAFEGGAYRVMRAYQIETDEGVFEAQIIAKGSESKTREYEGRQWSITSGGTKLEHEVLSDRGKQIQALHEQANQFLEEWANKLVSGQLQEAFLDTREPAERTRLAREYDRRRAALPVLALGVSAVTPLLGPILLVRTTSPEFDELERQLLLPGYAEQFHRLAILKTEKFRAADVEARDQVLAAVKGMFAPVQIGQPRLLAMKPGYSSGYQSWKVDKEGRVQLPHDCRMSIGVGGKFKYSALATITAVTDPGPVAANRRPGWRIVSVDLMNGEDVSRTRAAMGGPRASP
jgi:hypothetical protein